MITYKKNNFWSWDLPTRRKLRDCSYRGNGHMCECVSMRSKISKENQNTVVAFDGDKIVGWALHVGSEFHVYVKTDYRKRGIGTTLSSKAAKHYGCVLVD